MCLKFHHVLLRGERLGPHIKLHLVGLEQLEGKKHLMHACLYMGKQH